MSRLRSDARHFYLGYGEDVVTKEEGRIYADMGEGEGKHAVVFAASGSGKTELLARKTYEEILLGLQVFCIDPKGSKSWIEAFLRACKEKEILYDEEEGPVLLTLPYPEVSVRFNPLLGLTPHQIADVISSGVPPSKEAFWRDISYEITLAVALGLRARGVENVTLSDVYNYINVEKLEELRDKVMADVAVGPEREEALAALDKIATYDPQFFPRVNSSLRTYLTRLITGIPGKILNVKVKRNVIEERLRAGKLRFYAFLNSEAMRQVAYDVARLLFAWLLTYVGKQSARLSVVNPQLRLNVDEVTEIGFHEINKAIRLVRERNVSVTLVTQSPHGLMSAFHSKGKEIVSDIINSCQTRIFMRLNSPEDARYAASFCPEVLKPRAIIHKNHVSVTYTRGPALEPFLFQGLPPGAGVAFEEGHAYLFYSPMLKHKGLKIIWGDGIETEGREPIDVRLLAKNYVVEEEVRFRDGELGTFYEEIGKRFRYYRDDLIKVLRFLDGVTKPSVTKGNSPLRKVSLTDHLLRTARKAHELGEGLSQKERERLVLAALAHDVGKILGGGEGYETKDHERLGELLLKRLDLPEEVVNLAAYHHEKIDDPLAELLKKADHLARKEEEEKVVKEKGIRFNLTKFKELVGREVNLREDYAVVSDPRTVYVAKDYALSLIEKLTGTKLLTDEELEKLTGGTLLRAAIILKNKVVKDGTFLALPNWDPAEFTQRKKLNPKLFSGFRIKRLAS